MFKFAYRCSTCGINWPKTNAFLLCPNCDSRCWPKEIKESDELVELEDVKRFLSHLEFEKYYTDRSKKLMDEELARLARLDTF